MSSNTCTLIVMKTQRIIPSPLAFSSKARVNFRLASVVTAIAVKKQGGDIP